MSLNFQFPKDIDMTLIEYTKPDGSLHWHPRAQTLVFYCMLLQHDMDGEMTDAKLTEISRRINLMDLHEKHDHYWDKDGNGYRIQLADIVTYWGLTTNVTHLNRTRWDAYFKRVWTNKVTGNDKETLRNTTRTINTTRTP